MTLNLTLGMHNEKGQVEKISNNIFSTLDILGLFLFCTETLGRPSMNWNKTPVSIVYSFQWDHCQVVQRNVFTQANLSWNWNKLLLLMAFNGFRHDILRMGYSVNISPIKFDKLFWKIKYNSCYIHIILKLKISFVNLVYWF